MDTPYFLYALSHPALLLTARSSKFRPYMGQLDARLATMPLFRDTQELCSLRALDHSAKIWEDLGAAVERKGAQFSHLFGAAVAVARILLTSLQSHGITWLRLRILGASNCSMTIS
jgi:hypothetical protein